MIDRAGTRRAGSQSGLSIFIVAVGLTLILAITGFAVDLANLYVARNEAQRAADSAALAGASEFVKAGFTSGLMPSSQVAPLAAQQATQVGNQNLVIGQSPDLPTSSSSTALPANFNMSCPPPTGVSGGCFNFSAPNDPRITVVVYKNMPTYFMKVLGISSIPVSAQATAEVYNPAGGAGPTNSVQCLKPWLLPNCDFVHPVAASDPEANLSCGTYTASNGTVMAYSYFVDPNNNDAVVRPGLQPTGVIGEQLEIKVGVPGDAEAPSKFWPVYLPAGGTFVCPACAANDQATSGSNSAALYSENIECCSTTQITCGTTTVQPINGNMVGPTRSGVDCLIHQGNNGSGQDCISLDSSATCPGVTTSLALPFTMYAGSNNPYGMSAGSQITTSDSLVTLPIYDGSQLCPGASSAPNCPSSITVDVTGFLQMFVRVQVNSQQSSVYAYVLNVTGCGAGGPTSGGGGDGSVVPVYTGAPLPIRLVHN